MRKETLMSLNNPIDCYTPSRYAAGTAAAIVFVVLLTWFLQSLHYRSRRLLLSILLFVANLCTFTDLVLRGTLTIDELNSALLSRVRSILFHLSARLLLIANYCYLMELQGQRTRPTLSRLVSTSLLMIVLTGDVLRSIAAEWSLPSMCVELRQAASGLILFTCIGFYLIRCLILSDVRHPTIFPLLSISSACVLIEAVYVQATSIPSLSPVINASELWFYIGHLVPIVVALIAWVVLHPCRFHSPMETRRERRQRSASI